MENNGGRIETSSNIPEQSEQAFFGAVEKFPPEDIDTQEISTEPLPDQPTTASLPPETLGITSEQDVVKNTMPEVERNAEQMSKSYLKVIVDGVDQLKGKPYDLQRFKTEHEKNYIRQAFGREIGKAA